MGFFPEEFHLSSGKDNYLKLEKGEHKIRILSKPVVGYLDWRDKKPLRFRLGEKPANAVDPAVPIKDMAAFIVWNYTHKKIQVMEVTQRTILNKISALTKDEDWGDPYFYDIKITKSGEGAMTKYDTIALPHKPLDPAIKEAFLQKKCNLDAMFSGNDPFSEWKEYTAGVFSKDDLGPSEVNKRDPKPSNEEIETLQMVLSKCAQSYQDSVYDQLSKMGAGMTNLQNISVSLYERIMAGANKQLSTETIEARKKVGARA